jgi:hypothetical protein
MISVGDGVGGGMEERLEALIEAYWGRHEWECDCDACLLIAHVKVNKFFVRLLFFCNSCLFICTLLQLIVGMTSAIFHHLFISIHAYYIIALLIILPFLSFKDSVP